MPYTLRKNSVFCATGRKVLLQFGDDQRAEIEATLRDLYDIVEADVGGDFIVDNPKDELPCLEK